MLIRSTSTDSSDHELHFSSKRSRSTLHIILNYMSFTHLYKLLRLMIQKVIIAFSEIKNVIKCINEILQQMFSNFLCFFKSYPPAALFTINITLFAILLLYIGFHMKVSDRVESTEEWRVFLESFSKLELCVVPIPSSNSTYRRLLEDKKLSSLIDYETHSIPISLLIHPNVDFLSSNASIFHLSTLMSGKHIGLEGDDSQALINVTLLYKNQWNASLCNQAKLSGCPLIENVNGCVHFKAPKSIFPENKHLQHCQWNQLSVQNMLLHDKSSRVNNVKDGTGDVGKVNYGSLNWQMIGIDTIYYCRNRATMRANFDSFLIKPSENVIDFVTRQHLLRTSFFLTSFVFVVIFYGACFNHKSYKSRTLSTSSDTIVTTAADL